MLGDGLRTLAGHCADAVEKPIESYVDLETIDDEFTFVTKRRELVTFLRVIGTRDIKGSEDTTRADGSKAPSDLKVDAAKLVKDLKPTLRDKGHGIEVHYSSDPDRGQAAIAAQLLGARTAARSIGLDMTAFHDAQQSFLGERARAETCHLVLWTMPTVLSSVERKQALDAAIRAKALWPWRHGRSAQYPMLGLPVLRNRHDGFVKSIKDAFAKVDVEVEILDVHEAGVDMFESLWQGEDGTGFRLRLPGDPAPVNVPRKADPSAILWPKIGRQLAVWSADRLDWETARFGARIFSAVDVYIGPENHQDFGQLRDRMARAGVPFRMSMRMRSGGAKQMGWSGHLAPLGSLFGGLNSRVMKSLAYVKNRADDDGCVTWQCSFATWAEHGQDDLLQSRLAELRRCVSQWGTMQVRSMCGNPIEGVLSSALGLSLDSTAETGYAPLQEIFSILPRRVASPWQRGSIPFLTGDGGIFPYEEGSDKVAYHFILIFATMRSGKSVLLAQLVEGSMLASGSDKLPFLVFLDVGFGSSGIIEGLREALPHSRRSEVEHAKLKMTADFCMNIFDTPLGCRHPPPDQRAMIEEAFTVLVTPAENPEGHQGMAALMPRLIDEAYLLRDDHSNKGRPNRYTPGRDRTVDAAIERHRIPTTIATDAGTLAVTWYKITDMLFDAGDIKAAALAQRFAVPIASDLLTALQQDGIQSDFASYTAKNNKPLLEAVEAELKNALERYPICDGVTAYDPAARVTALDLQDVLGKGDSPSARKQTSVIYTWCMVALTNRWYVEPRDVATNPHISDRYRKWHLAQAEDIASTPKILVADEFHETSAAPATRSAIKKLVRKGPKYRIRVILASQILGDFDEEMRQLASSLFALSCDDEGVVRDLQKMFNLGEAHCNAIRKLGRRDRRYGVPMFVVIKTKTGRFAQLIYNAMSPRKLWSVATNPLEVTLRRKLTAKVGSFVRAVSLLAGYEPFRARGAEDEIATRIKRHLEQGNVDMADEGKVIDGMITELVALNSEDMRRQINGGSP